MEPTRCLDWLPSGYEGKGQCSSSSQNLLLEGGDVAEFRLLALPSSRCGGFSIVTFTSTSTKSPHFIPGLSGVLRGDLLQTSLRLTFRLRVLVAIFHFPLENLQVIHKVICIIPPETHK